MKGVRLYGDTNMERRQARRENDTIWVERLGKWKDSFLRSSVWGYCASRWFCSGVVKKREKMATEITVLRRQVGNKKDWGV